jgi:hypothetical protein
MGVRNITEPSAPSAREAADELAEQGYGEYGVQYLAKLASTAAAFPKTARRGISWDTHYEAGSPEMLKAIVEGAKSVGAVCLKDAIDAMVLHGVGARLHTREKMPEAFFGNAAATDQASLAIQLPDGGTMKKPRGARFLGMREPQMPGGRKPAIVLTKMKRGT